MSQLFTQTRASAAPRLLRLSAPSLTSHEMQSLVPESYLWVLVSLFVFIAAAALFEALTAHVSPPPSAGSTDVRKSEIPGTTLERAPHWSSTLFPGRLLTTPLTPHPVWAPGTGASHFLSWKPHTYSLLTAFAPAASSTFNSLCTSSSAPPHPSPIKASSTH